MRCGPPVGPREEPVRLTATASASASHQRQPQPHHRPSIRSRKPDIRELRRNSGALEWPPTNLLSLNRSCPSDLFPFAFLPFSTLGPRSYPGMVRLGSQTSALAVQCAQLPTRYIVSALDIVRCEQRTGTALSETTARPLPRRQRFRAP